MVIYYTFLLTNINIFLQLCSNFKWLGMMKRKMPRQPFTNYITVESIDSTLKQVKALGGKVALEKMKVGEMGAIVAFIDTESNLIGLHEMAKK